MLFAESQVDAVIDWWKDKGLTELTVSGEALVIPVFSKLLGLITCEGSGLSQSATQLWPSIFARLFCSLEDWFRKRWGRSARAWSHHVRQGVRHCAMRCECFWAKRRHCALWLEPRRCMGSMCDCTLWQQDCNETAQQLCMRRCGARWVCCLHLSVDCQEIKFPASEMTSLNN